MLPKCCLVLCHVTQCCIVILIHSCIFQDGKHTTALHFSVKNNEDHSCLHIVDFLAQNT